jgi:tetratricopeptide (TPR) repeat protein
MTVPWDDDNGQVRSLLDQGRQALAAGRFPEAAELFRQAYALQPSVFAASRYIHCLRKQGAEAARAAVVFARQPVEQWPRELWLIREYVWAIYEGYLKGSAGDDEEGEPAEDGKQNFDVLVKATRRILKLSPDELPRRRAVFSVCRAAKALGRWPVVLEFAMALEREQLPDVVSERDGHPVASPLQQWLYIVTRAHLELENYDECLQFAREGMERYPHVMFFPWWHALAQVRRGNVDAGLRELEQVHHGYVAPWYVRRDIAEANERLGKDEEAWRWYSAAALSPGEPKGRIPMLGQMAQLLDRLGRRTVALGHLLLAWTLAAQEEGWEKVAEKNREQVEAYLQRHAAELGLSVQFLETLPDPGPLLARCRHAWGEARR